MDTRVRRRAASEVYKNPMNRLFQGLLKHLGDPEVGLGDFTAGVPVGVGIKMPRLPAIFEPRRHWALAEQREPGAWPSVEELDGAVMAKYSSAKELASEVATLLDEQATREHPQVQKLSPAEARATASPSPRWVLWSRARTRPAWSRPGSCSTWPRASP